MKWGLRIGSGTSIDKRLQWRGVERESVRPLRHVISAGAVERRLVAAIESSALRHRPFDHIYMEQVFDPEDYLLMLDARPDRRLHHGLRHVDAAREDGSSTRLRMYLYPELLWRLPPRQRRVWMPIAQALCSKGVENAFKAKFSPALEERFSKPVARLRIYPIPILVADQPGYRIGIHSDRTTKAITAQFFLPCDSSQRHLGTIFHEGDSGEAAKRTTQMPFMPATGYAFPVLETKSWHSATTTTEADGERASMMVTYYVAEDPFSWLKYRLRRAALLAGIHPAG